MARTTTAEIPHGTYGGYSNHGCRCDSCRAAKRLATREYRARGERRREPDATICGWCQGPVPQGRHGGVPRRYCSDRCSDAACSKDRCGCGAWKERESEFCGHCAQRARFGERWALIERLWAEGVSLREMAKQLGMKERSMGPAMARWRKLGLNLPHRRTPATVARIRQAAEARRERAGIPAG